jgi:hypothetical protein
MYQNLHDFSIKKASSQFLLAIVGAGSWSQSGLRLALKTAYSVSESEGYEKYKSASSLKSEFDQSKGKRYFLLKCG